MVADEPLASADTLDIDVVKTSFLVGSREALGTAGEGEDGRLVDGHDGDLPGLVHALLRGGGHEHDDHEENHDDSDGVERAAVSGVEFHL